MNQRYHHKDEPAFVATAAAVFMLDPQGRILTWSAGAEWIMGYRSEAIVGQPVSRLYPAEAVARGEPDQELQVAAKMGFGWRS